MISTSEKSADIGRGSADSLACQWPCIFTDCDVVAKDHELDEIRRRGESLLLGGIDHRRRDINMLHHPN